MNDAELLSFLAKTTRLSQRLVQLASQSKMEEIEKTANVLSSSLTSMVVVITNWQSENIELRQVVQKLSDWQAIKSKLIFKKNMYWREGEDSPFCSACADARDRLIRLHAWANDCGYTCPECKVNYQTKDIPPIGPVVSRRDPFTGY